MNIIEKFANRFTNRGRALAQIAGGMACVKNEEPQNTILPVALIADLGGEA